MYIGSGKVCIRHGDNGWVNSGTLLYCIPYHHPSLASPHFWLSFFYLVWTSRFLVACLCNSLSFSLPCVLYTAGKYTGLTTLHTPMYKTCCACAPLFSFFSSHFPLLVTNSGSCLFWITWKLTTSKLCQETQSLGYQLGVYVSCLLKSLHKRHP